MATYNKKTVEQIAALIEEGNYSISNICIIVGISRKTFYDWKNNHPDFEQAIEDAEQKRTDELLALANKSLKKKLEGYYQTVSRTVYTPSENDPDTLEIKQHVVTRKYCEPDTKLLLDILGVSSTSKKKKGVNKRNSNPILVVKRSEKNTQNKIQDNINEVPPFTLKAKEVVDQTMPNRNCDKEQAKEQDLPLTKDKSKEEQERSKENAAENATQCSELKESKQIERNEPEQINSTSYPLPPGYTRRG